MTRTDGWTRRRFLKSSAVAAAGFAVTGRTLIGANRASASASYMCEFVNCSPAAYTCQGGTLYVIMHCYDAFSGYYCYSYWEAIGCCKG